MADIETLTRPSSSIIHNTKPVLPKKHKSKLRNPSLTTGKIVYTIDASCPVENNIFDVSSLEQYLYSKFKVNGSVGNKGDKITVTHENNIVTITSTVQFPKRYLKYLTKKFLKKEHLRDFFKVSAITKTSYSIRSFNIQEDAEKNE